MGESLAELRPTMLPDGWKATFSTVFRQQDLAQPPQRRVVCYLTFEGRNGQDGFEIDQDGRVIGHEPYRYNGGVLFTHGDVVDFATTMGFPSAPNAHSIAPYMSQFEKAFLRRIDSNEHPFYANQNVWEDVFPAEQPTRQVSD